MLMTTDCGPLRPSCRFLHLIVLIEAFFSRLDNALWVLF